MIEARGVFEPCACPDRIIAVGETVDPTRKVSSRCPTSMRTDCASMARISAPSTRSPTRASLSLTSAERRDFEMRMPRGWKPVGGSSVAALVWTGAGSRRRSGSWPDADANARGKSRNIAYDRSSIASLPVPVPGLRRTTSAVLSLIHSVSRPAKAFSLVQVAGPGGPPGS
jgi:hypothetical protein